MIEQYPVLIVIIPLAAALVVSLAGWRFKCIPYYLASIALGTSLVLSVYLAVEISSTGSQTYHVGGWPPPVGIVFYIDHFNALMLILVSFLGFTTAVWSGVSVEEELKERAFLFWCLYLLLLTGLFGIIVTGDLFNLFVLLEVSSLAGYALVAVGGRQAGVAGFRYLVIGTVGACFYLLGVGYLYLATGTLNMADLAKQLPMLYSSRMVVTAFVFIIVGFSVKIALFPFHAWQPDAYTFAPSAVSIIISTAMAKTFAYAMIRLIFSVFTIGFVKTIGPIINIICWVSAAAIVMGSVYAMAEDNLKRMLAYSSIANVGYIVLGVGLAVSTPLGLIPALMHMTNHAIIKGAMFMAAGSIIYRTGLKRIRQFEGMSQKMPYTTLALVIACLAMIGLPPSAGFVSKWYLVLAAMDSGQYFFVAVIFISTLLMLAYFWQLIEAIYIRPPKTIRPKKTGAAARGNHGMEVPMTMMITGLALAALSFLIGLAWISGWFTPFLNAINTELGLGGMS